jgi:hypothetical protein
VIFKKGRDEFAKCQGGRRVLTVICSVDQGGWIDLSRRSTIGWPLCTACDARRRDAGLRRRRAARLAEEGPNGLPCTIFEGKYMKRKRKRRGNSPEAW